MTSPVFRQTALTRTLCVLLLPLSMTVRAMPVEVTSSLPVERQIVPQMHIMNDTLGQLGAAVNENGGKTATEIAQAAQAQRDQDTFGRQTDRLEQSRRAFAVPETICTESGSGMAAEVHSGSRARQGALAAGQGISNSRIRQGVTAPTPPPEQVQYQGAAIHADYCDATDNAVWGGTALCKGVSQMPGADKRLASLFDGAGEDGKAPDLTFTQAQTDAAMAYVLNSAPSIAGKQPGKGEVTTASGRQYVGLQTEYSAINDAAREPMRALIAASQPEAATKDALKDALQIPSAAAYFNRTASDEAKRTGTMSEREFEAFDVGRRYANTDYQADLQGMESDNLQREAIRVQAQQNWLLLGIKQQLQKSNVLLGQQLSLSATDNYRPLLQAQLRDVAAGDAR
ncbi:conjugal transfer protein TraW [Enterobacter sp. PTB]|uniref:conjugal transfer protein TraW n=1 Tax=Enterobacter sp. PTB TaxID=3143437 RepID=UPI003DA9F6FA